MKVSLISLIAIIGLSYSVDAQIVPDSSLPQNTQIITLPTSTIINLGTERGSNLFHSFREFNVNDQQTVIFDNNSYITDIFTRVTGTNASSINGTISSRGAANLFLINPNGIILGNNARLFIGGSFFGTTASQINFKDGSAFNAIKPEKSLLSISLPVGFLFEPSLNGSIQVNNIGHDLVLVGSAFTKRIENRLGLFVQPNQTLALIGNGIYFDGGLITTLGGNIELGSVEQGLVLLNTSNANHKLDFTETHKLANIALSNKSLLDSSGLVRSGNIFVAGNNLSFNISSIILNQNVRNVKPSIFLEARGDVSFQGSAFNNAIPSSIRSEALGFFEGANIQISSQNLTLQNKSQIASQTFASGKGGNVSINASKNVSLDGKLSGISSIITSISTSTFGQGKAGNIDINAQNINIINGATISSGTFNTGNSGSIFLNALDTINISQREPLINLQSIVSSTSFNHGNAGFLTLNAKKIVINDGRIDSSTLGQGNSGSIFLNASESISIRGSQGNKDSPSGVIASADIADDSIRNLLENLVDLLPTPSGNSGSIEIQSPLLTLENNSTIQINNDGIGDGGSLRVNSNKIYLDEFSTLNASTKSGQGGNIFLNSKTVIFSNSSGITSNSEGIGNGGNISIDSNNLIVLLNSFIRANAFEGNGGNINIISPNVFISSDSRVTSSSVLGIDGIVNFSSPPISFFPQAALTANIKSEANINIVYGCLAVPSQAISTLKIDPSEANNNNAILSLPLISIDKISDRSHIPSASILVQDSNGKSWAASLVPSSLCNTQSN